MLDTHQNTFHIHCPNCSQKITMAAESILFQKNVTCPFCLVELIVDRENPKGLLEAIHTLHEVPKKPEGSE